jgi:ADP-ribose pyrophosphatase YjhB (NUDIX family)
MPKLGVNSIVMKNDVTVLIAKAKSGPDTGLWVIPGDLILDQESVRMASIRIIKEECGITIEAKETLFLCEIVKPDDHRISIFCFANHLEGEPCPNALYSEVKWVDVRDLGHIQQKEGFSVFAEEGFFKFSKFLKSHITSPSEGAVN